MKQALFLFSSTSKKLWVLFFVLSSSLCSIQAQDKLDAFDTLISKYASLNWSGVVLVGNNKELIYKKAFGYADREQKRPVQLNTPFKTESVGKMFTAVRIMQLISEGKLKLTNTVAELLPEWSIPNADKIQIKHMLNHTSGLSSPWEHPEFEFGKVYSKAALKKIIETAHIAFDTPGKRRYYSNSAYILLEEVIVKQDKQSFESSIREHIFNPAGMKQTRYLNDSILPADGALPYYQISTNKFVKDDTRYGDGKASGAGGWMSTAEDLFSFAKAYLNEKLLPADWMKVQITNDYTLADSIPDARFGLHTLRGAPKNSFVIGHNGGGKGFSVDVYFDVYAKNIVVYCSNLYGVGYALTTKAFHVLNNQRYPEPAPPSRVKLADWLLANPSADSITNSVFRQLEINDANDYLFFNVFDNLTLANEHKAAEKVMKICREKYPALVYSWVKSGENALALNNTVEAKNYFSKAYTLAEEQKDEEAKKMLKGKF